MTEKREAPKQGEMIKFSGELAMAEEESRAGLARKYPRDVKAVLDGILSEIKLEPATAPRMFYSIPYQQKGGGTKPVEGLSIKFATLSLRHYGNASAVSKVVDEGEDYVDVIGICHDYQTNTTIGRTLRCSRYSKVAGEMARLNEDRYALKIGATASKAVRNAILDTVPDFIKSRCEEVVKKLAGGKGPTDPVERVDRFVKAFAGEGVDQEMLEALIGKPLSTMQPDDARKLNGALTAIREGFASVETVFSVQGGDTRDGAAAEAEMPEGVAEGEDVDLGPDTRDADALERVADRVTGRDLGPEAEVAAHTPDTITRTLRCERHHYTATADEGQPLAACPECVLAAREAPVSTKEREASTVADLLATLEEVVTTEEFKAWPNRHAQAIINLSRANREKVLADWNARGTVKKFTRR